MDDDNLDELVDRSPGPGGHLPLSPAALDGDAGSSSEDYSGSEHSASADGDEDGRSGDEDDEAAAAVPGRLDSDCALSSDDDAESCPICLNAFRGQAVGTPETCAHHFCLDCILEWAKNANSCPVDRAAFKCVCIRARLGGPTLRTVPVESAGAPEDPEEDPTFCETCGRSDREDRLLLCDGCDAGYHMECLSPPLQEVPVDEWFCPECAAPGGVAAADAGPPSEEELSLLLADVVPTSSRLRPRAGRTRAIARTRQSERVRATVNRNRISSARSVQHVPRHLMSSLLDETIEAVALGLSTAVYQRPLAPRAPTKRRRKTGRRRKAQARRKAPSRTSGKSRGLGARARRRQGRVKRRGGRMQSEATARSRLAQTLGLWRPARGACTPSVHKLAEPSLGLLRADIGAAALSLFGDPYELDPFDSGEAPPTSPDSPLHTKRRALSQSALRSHQPVARPVSVGLSRRSLPAAAGPEPEVDEAAEPDLLGSILSGQSLLLMNSADVTIHRDGSLSAKQAAPVSSLRNPAGLPGQGRGPGCGDSPRLGGPHSGNDCGWWGVGPRPSCAPAVAAGAAARPGPAAGTPRPGQAQSASAESRLGTPRPPSLGPATPQAFSGSPDSPARSAGPGRALRAAPGWTEAPQLPRIPKSGQVGGSPAAGQRVELPSSCISRLTGREGPTQSGHSAQTEGEPGSRGPQEPSSQAGGTPAPRAPCRGKAVGSTFESFRINIPGNTAPAGRPTQPGFCNTFRPVHCKVARKEVPSPLFSLRKARPPRAEVYDPFEPTGSDSSSPASSPERLGPSLLPAEITRTISVDGPVAPAALAAPAVRCVTSYTVEAAFGAGPPSRPLQPMDQDAGEGREALAEGGRAGGLGPAAPGQRLCAPGPGEDEDGPPPSTFFSAEARTVTCVAGPEPGPPLAAPLRLVELPSRSRSRSVSSSRGHRGVPRRRASSRAVRRSRSGDRASRSASPAPGGEHPGRHRARVRGHRSSSERSSSREQARRRRARDRSREAWRGSWAHGRRRSRSGSPGSPSREARPGRKRPQGRTGSPPSGLDRPRRRRHPREHSRERLWERPSPRERRQRRPRSPSPEQRARQHRPRAQEERPRAPDACESRAAPAGPPPQGAPAPPTPPGSPAGPAPAAPGAAPAGREASGGPPQATPGPAVPAECPPDDLDYGASVEAGHVFEDLASDVLLAQLDDMSSPPSPESTDSSPERALLPGPMAALAPPSQGSLLVPAEVAAQPPPQAEGPPQERWPPAQLAKPTLVPSSLGAQAPALLEKEEAPSQTPLLRAKALVKRVTWNLQAVGDSCLRVALPRPQKPHEGVWEMDEAGPPVLQRGPFSEPPPSGHLLPEPSFPRADPAQVHSLGLPPIPALPSNVPLCAPASQPPAQLLLQGGLPLGSCGVAPSPAPLPTALATASEPAGHATSNAEERPAGPRPAAEKTKNKEYMKKLHVQERAVEEVKLAIKPFYQRREVTKDEYKDILRKAVQKICHSRSGEINPVKVGNLVKAYVDKYRHMRRRRRAEAGAGPGTEG